MHNGVHFLDKAGLTSAFAPAPSANRAEHLTCSVSDQSKTGHRSGARGQHISDRTIFLAAPEQATCLLDLNPLSLPPSTSVLPGRDQALAFSDFSAAHAGCTVLGISVISQNLSILPIIVLQFFHRSIFDSQIHYKFLKNRNHVLYLFIDRPSSWHRAHAPW